MSTEHDHEQDAHDHAHDGHDHDSDSNHEHGDHGHGHDSDHDSDSDHEHEHDDHGHDHGEHDHEHGSGVVGLLQRIFHTHAHEDHSGLTSDTAFMDNAAGIRTVWIALGLLTVTTVLQFFIVYYSGSVALLADTLHNLVDGANSVPLLIAFYLARRVANRRYNYGYGKAEDVAGVFIVLSIVVSAAVIFYESLTKLFDPQPLQNLGAVAAAAVIGFLGNEAVALIQTRTGRRIGSAALVADGLHARTDGLTSLAVLPAVLGSWLGFPLLDPLIGILIGVAILFITRNAAVSMWYRLMDAIEPDVLAQAEQLAASQPGVQALHRVRMRWVGSRLHADVALEVDGTLTTAASHAIAEEVRHVLFHAMPKLAEVVVHVEPATADGQNHHTATEHHEAVPRPWAKE